MTHQLWVRTHLKGEELPVVHRDWILIYPVVFGPLYTSDSNNKATQQPASSTCKHVLTRMRPGPFTRVFLYDDKTKLMLQMYATRTMSTKREKPVPTISALTVTQTDYISRILF